jgi:hypothetical protein
MIGISHHYEGSSPRLKADGNRPIPCAIRLEPISEIRERLVRMEGMYLIMSLTIQWQAN